MRAKLVSRLSVVSVLGLLLCAPLAAQDVPQEQPAEEEGLVQVPAQSSSRGPGTGVGTGAGVCPVGSCPGGSGRERAVRGAETGGADERSIENMPKTASPLALVALIGASSIAGGLGLRRFRRR